MREPEMAPRTERARLAFTVFDETDRLWSAILSLIDEGIDIGQLCIISNQDQKAALVVSLRGDKFAGRLAQLEPLVQSMKPCPWLAHSRSVLATSGPVLSRLNGSDCGIEHGAPLPKAIATLRESIACIPSLGVTGLIVNSRDPGQQSLATRTLLEHSLHWVTTHEFVSVSGREKCSTA